MTLCGVEENTLHLLQSIMIAVHERVVQDDQGRLAGFLEQVGVCQPADEPQLLLRAEAELREVGVPRWGCPARELQASSLPAAPVARWGRATAGNGRVAAVVVPEGAE